MSARRYADLTLLPADLEMAAPWLISLLDESLPMASTNLSAALRLFQCFEVWVHYCRIPASVVARSTVVGAVFAAVAVPQLCDSAIDCIVQVRACVRAAQDCSQCPCSVN